MGMWPNSEVRSWHRIPRPQQAGILCSDGGFRKYLSRFLGFPGEPMTEDEAAEVVREVCGVASRADLDTDQCAAFRWRLLERDYRRWDGR
jgi:hypothetical protein